MYIVVVLMVSSLHIKFVNVYQKMQKVTAAAKKRFTSRFTSGINIFMSCLNFIRLLQVTFSSSQQRLNRPAVNAAQSVQDNNSESQVFSANEYINYEYFSFDELVAIFCIKTR